MLSSACPSRSNAYSPPSCRASVIACNEEGFSSPWSCSIKTRVSAMLKHLRFLPEFHDQLLDGLNTCATAALGRMGCGQHSSKRPYRNAQLIAGEDLD